MAQGIEETSPLFRTEALKATNSNDGEKLLRLSPSFNFMFWLFLVFSAIIVIFLFLFDYTRRIKVSGKLAYEEGISKVYSQVDGVIVKKFVHEGTIVAAGDPLFSISTDRQSASAGSTADAVIQQIKSRISFLNADFNRVYNLQSREKAALREKSMLLKQQTSEISYQIGFQQSMLRISNDGLKNFHALAAEGFYSQAAFQEKQQANLDYEAKLHALLREKIVSENNLHDTLTAIASFDEKAENERNAIYREVSSLKQSLVEAETQREIVIHSSVGGTVTAVLPEVGQRVISSQILASVVPSNLHMYVQLNVPTVAVGLIAQGQRLLIRYASFPYERFGQYKGVITSIPKTALNSSELNLADDPKTLFYPVKADIESQEIIFHGVHYSLREGMQLDADVELESRSLAAWFIDPALSIKERYSNN